MTCQNRTKRKTIAAEDKKTAAPLKKTRGMVVKETAEYSEEVSNILEEYHHQELFELLQIIAVKLDKMIDGLAEMIIRDSLKELDGSIEERKREGKFLNKHRTKSTPPTTASSFLLSICSISQT